jgi:alkylhydroperoxidase/carboxymuconolactone decarboxylase family protein YurZ
VIQESAWGTIWTRPGLELKTRSLLNLVMLTALGKWIELGTHVRGAVRNGCSEVEIREALLQARCVLLICSLFWEASWCGSEGCGRERGERS